MEIRHLEDLIYRLPNVNARIQFIALVDITVRNILMQLIQLSKIVNQHMLNYFCNLNKGMSTDYVLIKHVFVLFKITFDNFLSMRRSRKINPSCRITKVLEMLWAVLLLSCPMGFETIQNRFICLPPITVPNLNFNN